MKRMYIFLISITTIFAPLVQAQDVILSDKEMLERELSLFTNHKSTIDSMLRATDSLILNPFLPDGQIDPLKANIRILLPGAQLRDNIDDAVAGYAIMNNLPIDDPRAINFGNFVYQSVIQVDKQNRDLLMKRYEQVEARIESLEFDLEKFGSETTQRERTAFEPGINYQITGRWRFGTEEVQFTQLAGNLWEGRYIHVENRYLRQAGYTIGMLVYRNVKLDHQSGMYSCEYLVRYADGSPPQWQTRELILEGNQLRTRRTGQVGVRLNK